MKSKYENEVLTLFLEGAIDSSNAEAFEKETLEALTQSGAKKLVVDAENLRYISSAGLRVLLKYRKKLGALSVINVSTETYDIFDVTGFTQLLDVHKRLRQVSVEGCELIGQGGFGRVFRTDPETIVKLYNTGISLEDVQAERDVAQKAFLAGVPTAISYDVIRSMPPEPDCYGVVYELLNAQTVAQIMTADPSRVKEMGVKSGKLLRSLHEITLEPGSLPNRKELFLEWVEKIAPVLEPQELDTIREFIKAVPDRNTFLHGDFNSKNIMIQNDEFILIDIGDATLGHPVFDLAGLFLPYLFLPKSSMPEDAKCQLLGFHLEDCQLLLNTMICNYFETQDPQEIKLRMGMLMPYAYLLSAYQGSRRFGFNLALMKERTIPNLRKNLLPAIKAAIPLDF